jgi:hypothetical protein
VSDDATLMAFARAIARGDAAVTSELWAGAPELALARLAIGASRQGAGDYFLDEIAHHVYAGDTALHVAAAAYAMRLARELIEAGAIVGSANRRGAQPLHYAVDGMPGSARWNPVAQGETVRCLVELGADPNVVDKNGTTPLHRAVRNRCAAAVAALLDAGADPHVKNGRGSTAIRLAHLTTGRGGSGSTYAKTQQQEILGLLNASGARA